MKKLLALMPLALALTAGAPPADAEDYGAFALDESAWAFAFAGGERTQAEADRQALSWCAQEGGRDCVIKYQYAGSRCGAAAVAEEQGLRAWGFGHADSRAEAIINAINYCKNENTSGGTCRKVAIACGDADPPQAQAKAEQPAQVAEAAPQAPQADSAGAPPAAKAEGYYYGAIARGEVPEGIYGISTRQTSPEAAREAARAECEKRGEHCSVSIEYQMEFTTKPISEMEGYHENHEWYSNFPTGMRCLAIVRDNPNDRIHYPLPKVAGSKEEAIAKARGYCRGDHLTAAERRLYHPGPCNHVVAACADDDAPQVAEAAPAPPADAAACADAEDCMARGMKKYVETGDFDGAIADFGRAIEIKPDHAEAYFLRGAAKHALNDSNGAVADYNRAIELKPDYVMAYLNRAGVKQYLLSDPEGAKADYNRAIENIKNDDANAYFCRGAAKQGLGDINGAIADLNRAIELKPDYVMAYLNRGNAKIELGDPEGGQADHDRFRSVMEKSTAADIRKQSCF